MDAPKLEPNITSISRIEHAEKEKDTVGALAKDILPKASDCFTSSPLRLQNITNKPPKGRTNSVLSYFSKLLGSGEKETLSSIAYKIREGLGINSSERKSPRGNVELKTADFSQVSPKLMQQFVREVQKHTVVNKIIQKQLEEIKTFYTPYYSDLENNYGTKNVDRILTFQLSYAYWRDYISDQPLLHEDILEKGYPIPSKRDEKAVQQNKRDLVQKSDERFVQGTKKLPTGTTIVYCSSSGAKRTQEDRLDSQSLTLKDLQADLIAVYDGHGGEKCVNFVPRALAAHLEEQLNKVNLDDEKDIQRAIEKAFQLTHQEKEFKDGTTATVAIRIKKRLYVAHLGDCQAQLIRKNGNVIQLTREQRSNDLELIMRGAYVDGGKIYGQVEAGGVFGDSNVPAIIRRPEISVVTLQKGDSLRMCSDGLEKLRKDEIIGQTPLERVKIGEQTKYDNATDLEAGFPYNLI